jgi:transmembrane sensor
MSFDLKDDSMRQATIERACAWFARHRAGELTAEEKQAFLAWMRESQLNMHEYLAVSSLRRGLQGALTRLDPDKEALLEQARADLTESSSMVLLARPFQQSHSMSSLNVSKLPRMRLWASAALLLVGVLGLWLTVATVGVDRIAVPRGEQRTVRLQDGSVVHVNADSKLTLHFSEAERRIELSSGQALFDVAPDKARRFRVRAGSTEVVAVGTRFDVRREADQKVTVTVLEGKVDVLQRSNAASAVRLVAGEQIHVGVPRVTPRVREVDAGAATAWVRGQAIFRGESLAHVVEELNRYSAVPLQIDDPQLLEMRINGVFNTYDVESFVGFLRQYGVEVEADSDVIRVRRTARVAE